MEIQFRGQIDLGIMRRVNRTALKPRKITLVLAGVLALFILWAVVGEAGSLQELLPVLLLAVLWIGCLAYILYLAPRRVLKSYKLLQSPLTGAVTESGVRVETEHSRSEVPWDVFLKRKIGKDIVLLYQSFQLYNMFPREVFTTEADWQAFLGLVKEHVPEKASRERGGTRTWRTLLIWLAIFVALMLIWNAFRR
jgi:predicted membrane protein